MSVETLRKIVKKLNERVKENKLGSPFFSQPSYTSQELNPDHRGVCPSCQGEMVGVLEEMARTRIGRSLGGNG